MKRLKAIQKEMEEMVDRINDDTEFNKAIDKLIEEDKELMKKPQQYEAKEKLEEALSKLLNETGRDCNKTMEMAETVLEVQEDLNIFFHLTSLTDSIKFRLNQLKETQQLIESQPEKFTLLKIENEARIHELETLLNYIKNSKRFNK